MFFFPPKFLVDLISLANALSSILRPSGVKKYKIHRRQPLNAVFRLLASTCIFCCVVCVLKQLCGGNPQLRLCLSDGEASKQGYLLLDCGPLGSTQMCTASMSEFGITVSHRPGCAYCIWICEQNFGKR